MCWVECKTWIWYHPPNDRDVLMFDDILAYMLESFMFCPSLIQILCEGREPEALRSPSYERMPEVFLQRPRICWSPLHAPSRRSGVYSNNHLLWGGYLAGIHRTQDPGSSVWFTHGGLRGFRIVWLEMGTLFTRKSRGCRLERWVPKKWGEWVEKMLAVQGL